MNISKLYFLPVKCILHDLSDIFIVRDMESNMSYRIQSCAEAHINTTEGGNGVSTDSLISVTSEGVVTAGQRTGDATILVTALETFGVTQISTLLVEVCHVEDT